jgi:hypothetical protein
MEEFLLWKDLIFPLLCFRGGEGYAAEEKEEEMEMSLKSGGA